MQPPGVVYMGWKISPIVVRDSSGFASMTIIADQAQEQRGSGVIGTFGTQAEAYQWAVAFGRSEVERRRLMTLFG